MQPHARDTYLQRNFASGKQTLGKTVAFTLQKFALHGAAWFGKNKERIVSTGLSCKFLPTLLAQHLLFTHARTFSRLLNLHPWRPRQC
jgi:hypothetical protein